MSDVLEIVRGGVRLRLCSNGIRWWLECDELKTGHTYRHEFRAGSRHGVAPVWERELAKLAKGNFDPYYQSTKGCWWKIRRTPFNPWLP